MAMRRRSQRSSQPCDQSICNWSLTMTSASTADRPQRANQPPVTQNQNAQPEDDQEECSRFRHSNTSAGRAFSLGKRDWRRRPRDELRQAWRNIQRWRYERERKLRNRGRFRRLFFLRWGLEVGRQERSDRHQCELVAAVRPNQDLAIRQDFLAFPDTQLFPGPVDPPVLLVEHAAEGIRLILEDLSSVPIKVSIVDHQLRVIHDLRSEPLNGVGCIRRAQTHP